MSEELKPCPSSLETRHHPYLAQWDDKHESLICPTAQVKCSCGFSGPERYGYNAKEEAIQAWNTRVESPLEKLDEEKVKDAINDWLSCGESRLTPDDVNEIAKTICERFGRQRIEPL